MFFIYCSFIIERNYGTLVPERVKNELKTALSIEMENQPQGKDTPERKPVHNVI